MKGISALEIVAHTGNPEVAEVFVARDPTRPDRLFEFVDGLDVRYPRDEKWIINVSTQYGCPLACGFCDAGGGFMGNIPAATMLAQVRTVLHRHPDGLRRTCRKLKVHFSRMGEPALNPAVLEALARLHDLADNPDLWACVATAAPRGTDAWFSSLFETKQRLFPGRFQLQFSVNSTDEGWRRRRMNDSLHTLDAIAALGGAFWRDGDRKIVLNFALARGVPVHPAVIGARFDPGVFVVKLTPLNPTARGMEAGLTTALCPSSPQAVEALVADLRGRGFGVIVSIGDGREDQIGSNCGQAVRHLAARTGGVHA